MTRAQTWSSVFLILLLSAGLRATWLGRRANAADEGHYRGDMTNVFLWLKEGHFRNHSVHHDKGAPHGLIGPLIAFVIARPAQIAFGPWLPSNDFEMVNFLSRLGYAVISTALVFVIFLMASSLYGESIGLALMLFAALSPFLINWGRVEYLDGPMSFFLILSFWAIWKGTCAIKLREQALCILLAAAGAALALGSKWSAIFVLPFMVISVPLMLWVQGRAALTHKQWALSFGFLLVLLLFSWSLLSLDSFQWALFPHTVARQDDLKDLTLGNSILIFFAEVTRRNNPLMVFVFWGGPFLVATLALGVKGIHQIKKRQPRSLFLFLWLLAAFTSSALTTTGLTEWRAIFLMTTLLIASGSLLENLSQRELWVGTFTLCLVMLPLTILQGLRLQTPIVSYYGDTRLTLSQLPDLPDNERIFHQRKIK